MADLPQDGIQDGAGIEGRPAAHGGTGRGGRVAFVDDGLDEHPLQVGEVHGGVITIHSLLSTNYAPLMHAGQAELL
jgi:hypothetical protein